MMNVKQTLVMETIRNERTYNLILPVGAPYGEAYDAAFEFLNGVLEMSKQAVERANQEPVVLQESDRVAGSPVEGE